MAHVMESTETRSAPPSPFNLPDNCHCRICAEQMSREHHSNRLDQTQSQDRVVRELFSDNSLETQILDLSMFVRNPMQDRLLFRSSTHARMSLNKIQNGNASAAIARQSPVTLMDTLSLILSKLPHRDLAACMRVSRTFNNAAGRILYSHIRFSDGNLARLYLFARRFVEIEEGDALRYMCLLANARAVDCGYNSHSLCLRLVREIEGLFNRDREGVQVTEDEYRMCERYFREFLRTALFKVICGGDRILEDMNIIGGVITDHALQIWDDVWQGYWKGRLRFFFTRPFTPRIDVSGGLRIRSLHINNLNFNSALVAPLFASLTNLRTLFITCNPAQATNELFINAAPHLKGLQVLVVAMSGLDSTTLTTLTRHTPDLRHLDVRGSPEITDFALLGISLRCPSLHHVNLGRTSGRERITDTACLHLSRLRHLTHLGLVGCAVTDAGIACVASRGVVRWLALNYTPIGDSSIRMVSRHCDELAVLEVKGCEHVQDASTLLKLEERGVRVECSGDVVARMLELKLSSELKRL